MKKNVALNNEIELLRKEINNFIDKNGLTNSKDLLDLSRQLDDAIVKWLKENGPKI